MAERKTIMKYFLVALASCGSASPRASLPSCCATYDDVRALDGRKVDLVGTYKPIAVRKGPRDEVADAAAKTVAIVASGTAVMLEIYYKPAGRRDDTEIARFAGRRVRVIGTLHVHTPSQLQTMIGPYISEIENIRDAP
jgi:hypothetical protein